MPRGTIYTKKLGDRICECLAAGATKKIAAMYVGINERSIYNWVLKGKQEGKGKFYRFYRSVREAEGKAAMRAITTISKNIKKGGSKEATWYLTRRFPEDFAKIEMNVNAELRPGKEIVEEIFNDEETTELISKLLGRLSKKDADDEDGMGEDSTGGIG